MTTKRFLSLFLIALLYTPVFILISFSQVNQRTIGRYEYAQFDGVWYTVVQGKRGDLVDLKHLLVRLKDKADIKTFDFNKIGLPKLKDVRGRFADGFYELEIPEGVDPFEVAYRLQNTGKFEEVLFNVFVEVDKFPNDPYYTDQWNLGKISISNAWDIETGSSNIIVAVIDVGADYNHEDLIANRWSSIGYDFLDNDPDPYPSDGAAHGTAVAGIIGAMTNNGLGVAGIAGGWGGTGGIRIMHLDAGWKDVSGLERIGLSASAQAIDYAAAQGAKVINMSFSSQTPYSPWESAINRAVNNYNVVCVASAGNYSSNESRSVRYPAAYDNVIAVGAIVQNDYRKELNDGSGDDRWGSCYGPQLDVVAPGIFIWSTDITGPAGYSYDNYTSTFSGTSASAPHVAGIAALILSVNPSLTWYQVRDIIRASADKVPGMGGQNRTDEYGYGRVNAYQALLLALAYANKSTDGGATNPNNVRQIAYGYGGQKLYLVFASGGEIFFRRSTDNGVSWDITKRLSTGDGNNCEPTITVHPYGSSSLTTTDGIHVVWSRRVNGNTFDIYYTKSFDFGQTWSNPVKIVSNVVISSYQFLPWPVIAGVSYQEGVNNLPKGMLPPSYVRALVLVFVDQNGLKWMYSEEPYTYWYGPYSLPSTAPGYFIWYPSVASYSGDSPFLYLTYDARFLHKIYSRFFNVETFSWSDEAIVYAYEYRGSGTDTLTYPRHSCVSVGMIHSKYAVWMGWDNIIQKWAIGFRAGNFSKDNTWSDWMWRYFELLNSLWYPSVCSYYSGGTYKIAIAGTREQSNETFILKADASLHSWSISTTGLNSLYAVVPNLNYWSGFAINFKQAMTNQSYPYTIILTDQGLPKLNVDRQFVEIDRIYRRALVFDSWRFEFGDIRLIGKDGEMKIVPLKTFDYSEPVDRSDLWKYLESEDIFNDGRFEKIKISLRISPPDIVQEVNDVLIFSGGEALRNIFSLDELKKGVDFEIPASKGKIFTVKPLVKFKGYQKEPGDFVAVENYLIDLISYYNASSYSISKSVSEPLLEQNYPNPFNPVTVIKFVVPADGHVILRVYDILGREIATLVDEYKKSGSYQVTFDASGLSSGVYFYRLDASGKIVQRKMLLVK
jgi:subtilisin family serine protease